MLSQERKVETKHPYLSGNFAPIHKNLSPTPCSFTGYIPLDLRGGQYVRNGANPISNEDLGRDAHWFDGDGMLSGVTFQSSENGQISPHFVNQFILTDVLLWAADSSTLRTPILPSIATLIDPESSLIRIFFQILRTLVLVLLSFLTGSPQSITRISVANTGLVYHDGRALATCESGPPIRIKLPGLETVGWFDGQHVEGEPKPSVEHVGFGGNGPLSFMREWTTGHPKVDPVTKEMILYHCSFIPPYVNYSVLPSHQSSPKQDVQFNSPKLLSMAVPGVSGAKMMHDFGVSRTHTIIIDLPLSLNPLELFKGQPVLHYDSTKNSRYGVFPRHKPWEIRWYETSSCCIFHSANCWDDINYDSQVQAVNMLVCRLTSASLVFAAGNISVPAPAEPDQCRLYYYRFDLSSSANTITHQFALSAIPLDFPTLRPNLLGTEARYVYGCSTTASGFCTALGKGVKIDVLAKIDTIALLERAKQFPPEQITGCVDQRSIAQILKEDDLLDTIRLFRMPPDWYAQEARFVPRLDTGSEDDGYLLFYAFDETQLDKNGEVPDDAVSELWILEAKSMRHVICRIKLPQRVPYGLHGCWFSNEEIEQQRMVESVRKISTPGKDHGRFQDKIREKILTVLG